MRVKYWRNRQCFLSNHDLHAKKRGWFVGQSVMARNMQPGPNWVTVTILEVLGPVTYLVETETREICMQTS